MISRLRAIGRPILCARRAYSTGRPGKGKSFLYGGVMLGAASIFGGLVYILAKDMLFQTGAYAEIDRAVDKIRGNSHLVQLLGGLPISVHGYTGNRGRRRPAVHEYHDAQGARCMDLSFFVQGQLETGRVSLQLVEAEGKEMEPRYFSVEIAGQPLQVLVQPPHMHAEPRRPSPFQRLLRP